MAVKVEYLIVLIRIQALPLQDLEALHQHLPLCHINVTQQEHAHPVQIRKIKTARLTPMPPVIQSVKVVEPTGLVAQRGVSLSKMDNIVAKYSVSITVEQSIMDLMVDVILPQERHKKAATGYRLRLAASL
jgi:hypothetical protein